MRLTEDEIASLQERYYFLYRDYANSVRVLWRQQRRGPRAPIRFIDWLIEQPDIDDDTRAKLRRFKCLRRM